MSFTLPPLPFEMDALQPLMSRETLEYHYCKHHQGYVQQINKSIVGTKYEGMSLEEIISNGEGKIFNLAAQIWNHTFFWQCLRPQGGHKPSGLLETALARDFGSLDHFQTKFTEAATGLFGSGWVWLVESPNGSLFIEALSNAGNPITKSQKPLLVCDVWEHAYYIDYRNDRAQFLKSYWELVNWEFAASNYRK